jgi:hypothetical protein
MASYEWDPDFDPLTQDIVVRGSNLTLRIDRETSILIWRKSESYVRRILREDRKGVPW